MDVRNFVLQNAKNRDVLFWPNLTTLFAWCNLLFECSFAMKFRAFLIHGNMEELNGGHFYRYHKKSEQLSLGSVVCQWLVVVIWFECFLYIVRSSFHLNFRILDKSLSAGFNCTQVLLFSSGGMRSSLQNRNVNTIGQVGLRNELSDTEWHNIGLT